MKKTILFIVLVCISTMTLFAVTDTTQFYFQIQRGIDYKATLKFVDNTDTEINSFEINPNLKNKQLALLVNSTGSHPYKIKFTFSPLTRTDIQNDTFIGKYKINIYGVVSYPSTTINEDISFGSGNTDATITLQGPYSQNGTTPSNCSYDISFDFSNYIDDYALGTYGGTIVAEITQV